MPTTVQQGGGADYTTLQAAINTAHGDDKIVEILDSASYEEGAYTVPDNDWEGMVIRGVVGQLPVLDGSGTGSPFSYSDADDNLTFTRLKIYNWSMSSNGGVINPWLGEGWTFEDCVFESVGYVLHSSGGTAQNPTLFNRCQFINVKAAYYSAPHTYLEYRNCLFDGRNGAAISVIPLKGTGSKIINCTAFVSGNHHGLVAEEVRNSIVINIPGGGVGFTGLDAVNAYNNLVQGFSTNINVSGTNSNNSDGDVSGWDESDVFEDYGSGDFDPAGLALDGALTHADISVDIRGLPRPGGQAPDIGCYEKIPVLVNPSRNITSATPRSDTLVRLSLDGPPNNIAALTDKTKYFIDRTGNDVGVTPTIDSVTFSDGNPFVDVNVAGMTQDQSYTLRAEGVTGIVDGSATLTGQSATPSMTVFGRRLTVAPLNPTPLPEAQP